MYLKMEAERLLVLCQKNCSGEVMENNLLPFLDYPMLSVFVISSSKRIFCDLCDLQKSQTVCLMNMAWTAFNGGRIVVL